MEQNNIIYQAQNGAIELKGDGNRETIRASLDQIASLFGRNKSVISRHINNIYKDEELIRKGTVAFFATVQQEGTRQVERSIEYFNLDMILSVGYRVNGALATKFRQRATQTLRQHITQGFTINKNLLEKNYSLFHTALSDIQALAHHSDVSSDDILELIKSFSQTRFSLDAFDKAQLQTNKQTQQSVQVQAEQLREDIQRLKNTLIEKGETTEFFAQEHQEGSLTGIVGNVFQSAFGADVYPSIESKASHLLYFIIKNHPFTDGNKRSAAFAFIWFLQKTGYEFKNKITPEALTTITLLIATSDPKDKERMINLVILLLSQN